MLILNWSVDIILLCPFTNTLTQLPESRTSIMKIVIHAVRCSATHKHTYNTDSCLFWRWNCHFHLGIGGITAITILSCDFWYYLMVIIISRSFTPSLPLARSLTHSLSILALFWHWCWLYWWCASTQYCYQQREKEEPKYYRVHVENYYETHI